jgi:dihydropteroate synthase
VVRALPAPNAIRRSPGRGGSRARRSPLARFSFAALPHPSILGVLNVTPDSFSDGGRYLAPRAAVGRARTMVAEGADLIDVGGESTRPQAEPVSERVEIARVVRVVERISMLAPISVDTTKAAVARAALEAGAVLVNDVSGATADRDMLDVVAEYDAGVILMHRRGTPKTMDRLTRYRDVVAEVKRFLAARAEAAVQAGIREDAIAVDPGIGFAKTTEQSLRLLGAIDELTALGFPVVIGVSRKRFIGKLLDAPVDARDEGTVAASLVAVGGGAAIVRVHAVAAMARALRIARAIWKAAEP